MVDRENIAPSLLILKEYAKNADRSYAEIAKITGKPESIVAQVVKEYASVYLSQESEPDFPMSLIKESTGTIVETTFR